MTHSMLYDTCICEISTEYRGVYDINNICYYFCLYVDSSEGFYILTADCVWGCPLIHGGSQYVVLSVCVGVRRVE